MQLVHHDPLRALAGLDNLFENFLDDRRQRHYFAPRTHAVFHAETPWPLSKSLRALVGTIDQISLLFGKHGDTDDRFPGVADD